MGESGGAALKGRGWPQDGWGVAIGRFQGYREKSLGWVAVKPHWVGFVEEAGLDVGPDERGLPPGRAEQVGTGGGACRRPGGAGLVAKSIRAGSTSGRAGVGLKVGRSLWWCSGRGGAGSSGGAGLTARPVSARGRALQQVRWGRGLLLGGACCSPPARIRVPGPGCLRPPWGCASLVPRSPHRHPRAR